MPWAAAAAIGGALISADASKSAAKQQARAAEADRAYQERIYEQQRADQEPWRQAGLTALEKLQSPTAGWEETFDLSKFQASPGYNNRIEAGQKAIERSAALRGNRLSGQTLKGITRFGQDLAAEEYDKARSQWLQDKAIQRGYLENLAGLGPSATSSLIAASDRLGGRVSNTYGAQGNAGAAGTVGAANAWSNAATQIGDWYAKRNPINTGNTVSGSGWTNPFVGDYDPGRGE